MTSQVRLYVGNCYKCSQLYLGASKVSVPGHFIKNTGQNPKLVTYCSKVLYSVWLITVQFFLNRLGISVQKCEIPCKKLKSRAKSCNRLFIG